VPDLCPLIFKRDPCLPHPRATPSRWSYGRQPPQPRRQSARHTRAAFTRKLLTVSGELWGVLVGGAIGSVGAALVTLQASRHQHRATVDALRRDGYMQILAWFFLTKDELRRTIEAQVPWAGDYSDGREQARMEALTELHGSTEFRRLTALWSPAFQGLLTAYERWLSDRARLSHGNHDDDHVIAQSRSDLEERQAQLRDVLQRIKQQARRETRGD
jgi:hypothetical protein